MHELPELDERYDILPQSARALGGTHETSTEVVEAGRVDPLTEDVARDRAGKYVTLEEG